MIRQRFDIFAGVGPKSAAAISQAGIRHWADFLGAGRAAGLPPRLAASVAEQIRQFSRALDAADLAFINRHLPRREHWCLYEAFAGRIRYLDIETTGLAAGSERPGAIYQAVDRALAPTRWTAFVREIRAIRGLMGASERYQG